MTHQLYPVQELQAKSLTELKALYTQLGVTVEVADKRIKAAWVEAIREYQNSRVQKVPAPQPINNLPKIGDSYVIGNFLLRCAFKGQLGVDDHAVAWDVIDESPMGQIWMTWAGFWGHTMTLESSFATPQQAVLDLYDCLHCYERQQQEESNFDSDAIVFTKSKFGNWESNVNGLLISVNDSAPDFATAAKKALIENTLEVFATDREDVYAVYNHKSDGLTRYEVNLKSASCTCPHDGFRDKHIETVRLALQLGTVLETDMLIDTPIDQLAPIHWEMLNIYFPEKEDLLAA